jgi:Polyferredoxin
MEGFAMTRQRVRKLTLIISLLLFPVTLYYFSPALIINAGLSGIVNGSFIVFAALLLLSIPFGRLFCAYLCPAGGLQECAFPVNERVPVQGWRNRIKYVVWVVRPELSYLLRNCMPDSGAGDSFGKEGFLSLFLLDGAFYGGRHEASPPASSSGPVCAGK